MIARGVIGNSYLRAQLWLILISFVPHVMRKLRKKWGIQIGQIGRNYKLVLYNSIAGMMELFQLQIPENSLHFQISFLAMEYYFLAGELVLKEVFYECYEEIKKGMGNWIPIQQEISSWR